MKIIDLEGFDDNSNFQKITSEVALFCNMNKIINY